MSVLLCYDTTELKDIMTIAELIKELEQYPQDIEVIVPGISNSIYNNIETLELKGIHSNFYEPNKSYYFGEQLNFPPNYDDTIPVLIISGNKIL